MSDLNDPRVLFAAERTALAWTRTSLTLTAFGFTIERFGLFIYMLVPESGGHIGKDASYWIGLAFILLGAVVSFISTLQYRTALRSLRPIEIPPGYKTMFPAVMNISVTALAATILLYLLFSGPHSMLMGTIR